MADSNPSNPFFRRNNNNSTNTNNPYQNLYNLPTSPEFLFHEEAAAKNRSWAENLQFYTGSAYLAGAVFGGAKGTVDAVMASESGDTAKLRVNRILNSGGQAGRKFGNSLGILGLMYGGLESAIMHYAGTDDVMSSVLAGLGTGAIYKAASGPRSAALAGAIGGLAAGAAVAGKQMILPAIKRYVPNIPI